MASVTATQARQGFAELIERVIAGEEIAIERHGRVVARLVPVARAEMAPPPTAGVAPVVGVSDQAPLSRILRGRAAERLRTAAPRASSALARLAQAGVKARLIGSLAKGTFRPSSDVDILVEDRGPLVESAIEALVRAEMKGFPFDLVYEDRVPAALRSNLR